MNESQGPSKQFLISGGIAVGIIAIILIVQTHWFLNLFHAKKHPQTSSTISLADVVNKDSNGNGIPDWQEILWGLDPKSLYTNGKPNADIIKEKQAALGINSDSTADDPANQTDEIAQKLFTITTALSQNPNIDDATLQTIANQLGASVNVASIGNKYSLRNIHTVATTTKTLTTYDNKLTAILNKTDLTQADITIIVNAAETGDYSQLPTLAQTGATYTALAAQIATIAVPIGVAQYDLDIINSFTGMATSFTYIMQMQDDGTQALVGIALYKVYSTRGEAAFDNLHDYLIKYGILTQ